MVSSRPRAPSWQSIFRILALLSHLVSRTIARTKRVVKPKHGPVALDRGGGVWSLGPFYCRRRARSAMRQEHAPVSRTELLQLLHAPFADTLLVAERLNVARINVAVAQNARQDLERQPSKLVDLRVLRSSLFARLRISVTSASSAMPWCSASRE